VNIFPPHFIEVKLASVASVSRVSLPSWRFRFEGFVDCSPWRLRVTEGFCHGELA
jgi:hypothetical protein